ncbi:MAG: carboxypeptidase regulatory-like domain-containing protein [Acidimicrobiales bacterium]|nr:carboxypeptidase regulatory-like domain-containing protein [Acidimicrobiales bacterium]
MITILVHNPEFRAAPAAPTSVRVDVVNSGDNVARINLDVLGAPASWIEPVQPDVQLQPGETWRTSLVFTVPLSASRGNHRLAVRVIDHVSGETTLDDSLILTVASHEGLSLSLTPASLRGRFRARSRVIISNRSTEPVRIDLSGEAESLRLRFKPATVDIPAGEERIAKVRVRSRPRWLGHNRRPLSVIGSGSHLPVRTEGSFEHRPLFGSTSKAISVATLLIAIAVGAFFGLLRLFDDDTTASSDTVDSTSDSGDVGAGGDANDDNSSGDGETGSDSGEGDEGPSRRLNLEGTVALAGAEEASGVDVVLRRISLDSAEEVSALGGRETARASRKVFALAQTHAQSLDDTDTPITVTTAANGRWTHINLVAGLHYEISFQRSGYVTQSFVISPQLGVELAALEIELEPGDGILGGQATGVNGPIGGAIVRVTDGELVYTATTSTDTDTLGQWMIEGLATPGRYVVSVEQSGFGTEVFSVELQPGETQTSLATQLVTGVGSITGVVRVDGDGYGGATVTASAGDVLVTTTTLTAGAPGTFTLPRLPVGLDYKLEIAADGRLSQTRSISVEGPVNGLVIDLISATGAVGGSVSSDNGSALGDVIVTISSDTLSFRTTTEATEGRWEVRGVPPGEYQVAFQRFDYADAFANITVTAGSTTTVTDTAGAITNLTDTVLVFSPDEVVEANARLTGLLRDNKNQPVVGAVVQLPSHDPPKVSLPTDTDGRYEIPGIDFGSYLVRVVPATGSDTGKQTHQNHEDFVTFTLNETVSFSPQLFTNGAFNGRVAQADAPTTAVPHATLTITGPSLAVLPPLDQSGSFNQTDFFPPGEYTLVAEAPGYLPSTETRTIPDGLPVPITVNFELNLRPRLQVNVVEPDGVGGWRAVTDATVTISPPEGATGLLSKAVDTATGTAEFAEENVAVPGATSTKLVAGSYTIDVSAPGRDSVTSYPVGGVTVAETRTVTVALTGAVDGIGQLATGIISYQRDLSATPISGASVTAEVTNRFTPATPPANPTAVPETVDTQTDETGRWSAPLHRFGSAVYTVTAPNFATGQVTVDVTPGATVNGNLTLTADDSTLSGGLALTTDDANNPPGSFAVTAAGPGGASVASTALESNGSYSLTVSEQGTWTVTVSSTTDDNDNFVGVLEKTVTTQPGQPTVVSDFVVTELSSVVVPVSPATATVELCSNADGSCESKTAVAGNASFSRKAHGNYTVTVSQYGFADGTADIELLPGEDKTIDAIGLAEWGTITGTLFGRIGTGSPSTSILPAISVTATPTDGGTAFGGTTDSNGNFSISAPDGSYVLAFALPGYLTTPEAPATLIHSTQVQTTKNIGDVIFRAADRSVSLTVVDDTDTPITATVNFRQAHEDDKENLTHQAGSSPLTVTGLQPRTWTIEVSAEGHNSVTTTESIPTGVSNHEIKVTVPRNTGKIQGTIQAEGHNSVSIGSVGGVDIARIDPAGTTVTSATDQGTYTVLSVINGDTILRFSKVGYVTKDVTVDVTSQDPDDPNVSNVVLTPDDGTITLTVEPNATANFANLSAQLWLDTEAGGTQQMVGAQQTVGVDRTVSFAVPPSTTALEASSPLHRYRIELFGTGFENLSVDDLDLLPGGTLTPSTPIVAAPGPPSLSEVKPLQTGGVQAIWTAPAETGGAAITEYLVEVDIGSAGTFGLTFVTAGTSYDITDVNPGDLVSVRVSARNGADYGSSSAYGSASGVLSATAPRPPAQVGTVEADAENAPIQIDLSWDAPAANGSDITGYKIQFKPLSASDWPSASLVTLTTPATTASLTSADGLTANTAYDIRVRAVNGVGDGDYSAEVSATTVNVPAQVGTVEADAENAPIQIDLSWFAPVGNGLPIDSYDIQFKPSSTSTWTNATPTPLNATTASLTSADGLTANTAYDIRVRAVNGVGDGDYSAEVSAIAADVPDAPDTLSITQGDQELVLSWTAPANNGSAITRYEYRINNGSAFDAGSGLNETIDGLTNGTLYSVDVRAVNVIGPSEWSNTTGTPRTTPTAPTPNPTAGNTQITVTWTAPENGGATITSYDLRHRPTGTTNWTQINNVTSPTDITSLTNGTEYEVQLRATNAAGPSAWSASANTTPS